MNVFNGFHNSGFGPYSLPAYCCGARHAKSLEDFNNRLELDVRHYIPSEEKYKQKHMGICFGLDFDESKVDHTVLNLLQIDKVQLGNHVLFVKLRS